MAIRWRKGSRGVAEPRSSTHPIILIGVERAGVIIQYNSDPPIVTNVS